MAVIDEFQGKPQDLVLSLPELLFGVTEIEGQPATGVAGALLTDRALARGWLPVGSQLVGDRRIWKFGAF
jgi:hypothetical protein